MYITKARRQELSYKIKNLSQSERNMLHAIGIDGTKSIKLSSKGYLYHNIYRNHFCTGGDESWFMKEREQGLVRHNGGGWYSVTRKGKIYLGYLIGVVLIDVDGFIKDS